MSRVFFGGSRTLPTLDSVIRTRIQDIVIKENSTVLIGDANGADRSLQTFFANEDYRQVVVYCMDGKSRNNVGNWEIHPIAGGTQRGFQYFAMKDIAMSRDADYGVMLWDGKSKGTLNNVLNLLRQRKKTLVHFSPTQSYIWVESAVEIRKLIDQCDPQAVPYFDATINLSERLRKQQRLLDLV